MIEVNTRGLCTTRHENKETKTRKQNSSEETISLSPILLEVPVAILPLLQKEKSLILYLVLKKESPGSGLIQNYPRQISYLSKKYSLKDENFIAQLNRLHELKLIEIKKEKIRLLSWKNLGRVQAIEIKPRKIISLSSLQMQLDKRD